MAVRQIIRVRGVKGLSENNQTLRRACPERDSSVASLLQNDKGEGLRVTEDTVHRRLDLYPG